MDVRRVEIFRAVAHAGSLAAAARQLHVTQPAVSQQVAALERQVGAPLVVRTTRGIRLTEAGRVLLVHADAVAARLRSAADELAALAALQTGTVRLAAFPSAAATLVPAALAALPAGLEVRLQEAEPPEALVLVRSGEVDAALVFSYVWSADLGPDLVATPLAEDPVRVVTPAGESFDGLHDLSDRRWVSGCPRCGEHLLRVCGEAGFTPDVRHSTDDYVVVQALVAAGLGVALLPALALQAFRHPGVAVHRSAEACTRSLSLVQHAETSRTPALRALVRALAAHSGAKVPVSSGPVS